MHYFVRLWREEQKTRLTDDNERRRNEIDSYLAKIRRTIAESASLVSQAELRIAETDRLLASQGLTREQVLSMRISESQREAVNNELRRRGLDPLDEPDPWASPAGDASGGGPYAAPTPGPAPYSADAELAERREKFGMMMKPFQI